ncbi:MAG: zinc ribbon domain-containing protein [Gammaproteobacteria bacterium]
MQNNIGIISFGTYVPTMRLQRKAIADAVGWATPGLQALASGSRAVANWDEDAITMAVEAGRHCLDGFERASVGTVTLASTTLPFADRSNSGIAVDALNLNENVGNADSSGSRRAASSALIRAMNVSGQDKNTLLLAADCREAKPGSVQELTYGHAAAALLLGKNDPIAVPIASASIHRDLVDQFRSRESSFDYALEQRWVRDEGYFKIVPDAIKHVLEMTTLQPADIHHFALAGPVSVAGALAKKLQFDNANVTNPLHDEIGDSGVTQPIMLLSSALARAKPGENILLVGFGQGVDVLIFQATDKITQSQAQQKFNQSIQIKNTDDNYIRYLVLRQQLDLDYGIRAERDNRTALSTFYRKRDAITGFIGGRCTSCGMLQFPKTPVCVRCDETDTQAPESLAELTGKVKSFTEDWLAYTPCPPLIYGNVTFPDGANVMMEFTDFSIGELAVNQTVRMAFRIKDFDNKRNFRRYFWKPAPHTDTGGKR